MTKIKLCGLSRIIDIETANELNVDYIGFVFASNSKRYIDKPTAKNLKEKLNKNIKAVGVFVNENIEKIANYITNDIIDIVQLHGNETNEYIKELKATIDRPIIKAFKIANKKDISITNECLADYILLDSGAGDGKVFDWDLIKDINRSYFLAGGLSIDNVSYAIKSLNPYAVDVSSGIETDSIKDKNKMKQFVEIVNLENKIKEES